MSPTPSSRRRSPRFPGVGQVTVGGSSRPGVRAEVNPLLLSKLGVGLDQVRTALNAANADVPKGALADEKRIGPARTATTSFSLPRIMRR